GGSNSEMEQTLNQILTEMDGFENDTGVIVMAATNREEILDTALLRPGRFDRKITIGNPTIKDREAILKVHSKNKPIDKNVNLEKISARTVGFSGADLQNLLNESAIFAARAKSKTITDKHIDLAIDRIAMGTEKKSLVMSDEEKKMTAYHEVGHALMAHLMPKADPVHKITIVPRGRSLGATHMAPDKESYHSTKQKYLDEICVLLGGLSAEKIIFKDTTSGVSNDLERATTIANAMVKKFGMSDEIGPMIFMDPGEHALAKSHSEEFSGKIDTEVQAILKNSYKKTLQTLEDNMDLLHSISKDLLEKETLSREQFEAFFKK
ncbi:TPA: AAA family ATPase, partial [Candidatus Peregrinibacteria bacterium]|nr:AAA family ATPase [Candidatus Peregrinibacteria bacterium]